MSDVETETDSDFTDTQSVSSNDSLEEYSDSESDAGSCSDESVQSRVTDRSSCKSKVHTSKNVFKLYKQSRERVVETLFNNEQYEDLESLGIFIDEQDVKINDVFIQASNMYGKMMYDTIDCIWSHPNFENINDTFEKDCEMILNPPTVMEGFVECMYCKSTKTINFQKQTRSADEGATTFIKCMNPSCGKTSRTYA